MNTDEKIRAALRLEPSAEPTRAGEWDAFERRARRSGVVRAVSASFVVLITAVAGLFAASSFNGPRPTFSEDGPDAVPLGKHGRVDTGVRETVPQNLVRFLDARVDGRSAEAFIDESVKKTNYFDGKYLYETKWNSGSIKVHAPYFSWAIADASKISARTVRFDVRLFYARHSGANPQEFSDFSSLEELTVRLPGGLGDAQVLEIDATSGGLSSVVRAVGDGSYGYLHAEAPIDRPTRELIRFLDARVIEDDAPVDASTWVSEEVSGADDGWIFAHEHGPNVDDVRHDYVGWRIDGREDAAGDSYTYSITMRAEDYRSHREQISWSKGDLSWVAKSVLPEGAVPDGGGRLG